MPLHSGGQNRFAYFFPPDGDVQKGEPAGQRLPPGTRINNASARILG